MTQQQFVDMTAVAESAAVGLQLGIALLTTLQAVIEAAHAAAIATGQDPTRHQAALAAVTSSIAGLNSALGGAGAQS